MFFQYLLNVRWHQVFDLFSGFGKETRQRFVGINRRLIFLSMLPEELPFVRRFDVHRLYRLTRKPFARLRRNPVDNHHHEK